MGLRTPQTLINLLVIADAAVHYSVAVDIVWVQEKTGYVFGVMAAAPGRLDAWVEVSPDGTNYTRLGAVQNIVATGSLIFPWTTHSTWMRMGVQAPLWAAGSWTVNVIFEGKS